ncbi:major facilitator superfamily domain-containing protein, partial [Dichotomocladium elegans]
GVMQDHLEQNVFGKGATVKLSGIATMINLFIDAGAVLSRFIDLWLGTRKALALATCLISGGLLVSGCATEVWHLYLSLGICLASGASISYEVSMRVVPQWFSAQSGLAMSVLATATGFGGIVFPFALTALNQHLGYSWTFRILSLATFLLTGLGCSLIRERRPENKFSQKASNVIHLGIFHNINFSIWCLAAFLQVIYLFIPPYFLPLNATSLGLSTAQGSSLASIYSSATIVGRVALGLLGDRIGCLEANCIYAFLTGIFSLTLWVFAKSYNVLAVYSALFGLFGGSYYALCGPITESIVGVDLYPGSIILLLLTNSPAQFSIAVANALENISFLEPFFTFKLFTGLSAIGSSILMAVIHYRLRFSKRSS